MDDMTPEQRRKNMQAIRSRDTQIEQILRRALWRRGIRYRKNDPSLPGTPDIAITRDRIAIFCDGEFFHGYQWDVRKRKLGQNRDYWIGKIERNMTRDRENDCRLIAMDWVPVHFWGREIKGHPEACADAVEDLIFELRLSRRGAEPPAEDPD